MGWRHAPEYGPRNLSATHWREVPPLGYTFGRITPNVCGEEPHAPDPRSTALPARADAMKAKGAHGVSADTRTDRGAEDSSGNNQETPNKTLHRIAARLRFGMNVNDPVCAAARDGKGSSAQRQERVAAYKEAK